MTIEVEPRVMALVKPCLDDPEFEGGSTHVATIQLTNPTAIEFTYTVVLYLGPTAVVSAEGIITIPAGGTDSIVLSLTMPIIEGVYPVFLDVYVGGVLVEGGHYQTADITISVTPAVDIGDIVWG